MTFCSFNVFIIVTAYLGVIFKPSHGLKVIQPENRTVNPDKSATISCEHDEPVGVVADVRLYSVPLTGKPKTLCQKGMKNCENVVMYQESSNKFTFVLLNIGPEAMDVTYQCEISLTKDDIHLMDKGIPTRLQQGQKEAVGPCESVPPPPLQSHLVQWIVVGLLTLMFLYSCVITCLYIRLMNSDIEKEECENSTYVEMRKASPQRNADLSVYSG